jgi:excinuclease ABC subunit A
MFDFITIKGARLHNLKNITLSIPKNKVVVLTGVSGSGKSTLAFDILHKEGQRQYMESLGMVTYVSRPPVDAIEGLSPSISVDQYLTNRSPRSTVGTATEVFTYLRVLYARLGHRVCAQCGADVPPSFDTSQDEAWDGEANGDAAETTETYPCPHCGAPLPELGMAHFSFNKPAGACPTCTGLGVIHTANLDHLIDPERSIQDGGVLQWVAAQTEWYTPTFRNANAHYHLSFDLAVPIKQLGDAERAYLLYGVDSPQFRKFAPNIEPPANVREGRFEGLVTALLRRYFEHADNANYREKMEKILVLETCPDCQGTRLRPESRAVTVAGQNIIAVSQLPLNDLAAWIDRLEQIATPDEWLIAESIVFDLHGRIHRLIDVGVGYLTLDRATPSLSAGEAQRLRLAALLGSGLTGVLYVLDEPTIGLHPRDTARLIKVMRQLRDLGNTVLVVEHDLEVIRQADYVVDVGPGAGKHGGRIMGTGTPDEISATIESVTGNYLAGRSRVPIPEEHRGGSGQALIIHGAREHNLKNITVSLPLGTLIAVAGPSGSGKSSLMFDILDRAARQRFFDATDRPGEHDRIAGWEQLDKIITIDQTPIGRSARSNAATYTDAFTPMREVFAAQPEAKQRGLSAKHFSFNVAGGRCDRCEGAGVLTMNMHFLPDVEVRCPACHGKRFKRDVLAVKYRGHDIAQLLDLTIEEALPLFADVPAVAARLSLMVEVGLGYLQLGQPATTLSGGEAQRVKLAKELGRRGTGRTLYLLDEPTTGLHAADVAHLLKLLQRLVEAGNTVVTIEHNLELIRAADWIIDLGPEGGEAGGYLIAAGTPEQIKRVANSATGKFL